MRRKVSFELVVLVAVVVLVAIANGIIGASTLHQSHEGAVAKQALCAQRVALGNQIKRTATFLDKNPDGIPGVPVALIRAGLNDNRAQWKALSSLHCQKGTP